MNKNFTAEKRKKDEIIIRTGQLIRDIHFIYKGIVEETNIFDGTTVLRRRGDIIALDFIKARNFENLSEINVKVHSDEVEIFKIPVTMIDFCIDTATSNQLNTFIGIVHHLLTCPNVRINSKNGIIDLSVSHNHQKTSVTNTLVPQSTISRQSVTLFRDDIENERVYESNLAQRPRESIKSTPANADVTKYATASPGYSKENAYAI